MDRLSEDIHRNISLAVDEVLGGILDDEEPRPKILTFDPIHRLYQSIHR
ncbi:MAG: hypothetical protein LBK83_11365 [Treponema sp.]|jgi:hypothetical protein|nr:hypothetical protein [Treponema sp.]